jgi:glycosyltransferase involved in cell wall biosynthesis
MANKNLPKLLFITEAIRRDIQLPLKNFRDFEIVHLYLDAPYGDMTKKDLAGCKRVKMDELLDAIVGQKPDIIQGVEPFGSKIGLKLSYISYLAKRKTGAKLVCPVFENRPIKERFNLVQRIVLRFFCPRFFKSCDRIFALKHGAVENIRFYSKRAKVKTGILWGVWGVDTDFFAPKGEKDENLIVYIGRWVSEKGIMYRLEGFRGALNKIPKLKLNLVGQGPLEEAMRCYVRDNVITDAVRFLGFAKSSALPGYFSRASLACYPSVKTRRWEEQVGTVNFQALSCGTPVLTTRGGAIEEYIKDGEGAILVEEKSAKSIEQAIIKFFSDQDLKKKLTARAREYAKKYDIKRGVEQAEKELQDVLRED